MKIRKLTAALLAAALVASVATTATAATVPSAVYGMSRTEFKGYDVAPSVVGVTLQVYGVKDVPATHFGAVPIAVMIQAGLISPDKDGNVNPDARTSVANAVAVFAKILGIAGKGDDALTALALAQEAGLVGDVDDPDREMTRLEVGQLIALLLGIKPREAVTAETYPFTDFELVSQDDARLLAALYDAGIFKGYEDHSVRPGGLLTTAELATLLYRVLGTAAE